MKHLLIRLCLTKCQCCSTTKKIQCLRAFLTKNIFVYLDVQEIVTTHIIKITVKVLKIYFELQNKLKDGRLASQKRSHMIFKYELNRWKTYWTRLREEQQGVLRNGYTIAAISIVKPILETSTEFNLPAYLCFVYMPSALNEIEVNIRLIQLIFINPFIFHLVINKIVVNLSLTLGNKMSENYFHIMS